MIPLQSKVGSIVETSRQEPLINFVQNDSIGDILSFDPVAIYEQFNLSHNPVEILSFDNVFLGSDIAQRMIPQAKRLGTIHVLTMDIDPGYKTINNLRGKFYGKRWKEESLFQISALE